LIKTASSPEYDQWNSYVVRLDWRSGRHDASYKAEIKAVSLGLKFEEVEARITELMIRAGRKPQPGELSNQWPRAVAYVDAGRDGTNQWRINRPKPVTPYNVAILRKQAEGASSIDDIRSFIVSRSPENVEIPSQEYFRKVFPDQIVVVFDKFRSAGYWVKPDEDTDWLEPYFTLPEFDVEGAWFLSNPVDGKAKGNTAGNLSGRSEGNLISFLHVV
jgi:hypothetical protein